MKTMRELMLDFAKRKLLLREDCAAMMAGSDDDLKFVLIDEGRIGYGALLEEFGYYLLALQAEGEL